MSNIQKYLKKLTPRISDLGQQGVDALSAELAAQAAKADEGWKEAVLDLLADSVAQHGPEGLRYAQEALENLMDGKRGRLISDITDDLETASNLLAELQNSEADRKKAVRRFLEAIGQILAAIAKGFLKAL